MAASFARKRRENDFASLTPRIATGCRSRALPSEAPAAHSHNSASELWGLSSAGRAPDLHSGGQRFDPARLHHLHIVLAVCSGQNRGMNVCAITMVYQDYFALTQWVRHYSNQLGIENLFIVAHGHDPKVNEIAAGANIWTIPRDNLERFDRRRNWMLNKFQSGLLKFYDWVIRTDTDELVCVDPTEYSGLKSFLSSQKDDVIFAIGLDLFEASKDAPIDESVPVFDQRASVIITGNYSKAWAIRDAVPLMRHGAKIAEKGEATYSFAFPATAYLVHLKFASKAHLFRVNETRKALGRSDLAGMPGTGWQKADNHAKRFFEKANSMDVATWEAAIEKAHTFILSDMKFSEDDGVIRSPGHPHIVRTTLPEWFKTY